MSRSDKTILDLKLADADSDSLGSLAVRIEASDFAISIYPQGHGDFGSADGHGCPVFIELYQGHLRVIAFPDINTEFPQIIDLNGAREDHRRDANGETTLQKAQRFTEFMQQTNPETGEPFTFQEAAVALDVECLSFLRMLNIWRDERTRLNDEGQRK
jgi:hypothetical protein